MQVNPSPPRVDQNTRSLGTIPQAEKDESAEARRYDATDRSIASIDGVLLNTHNTQEDFSAIQAQIRNTYQQETNAAQNDAYYAKPAVGSDEWYKARKDNHKEVERRRRETINKGIDALAGVVPDCDKHKGQILQRAVEYIKKLKENETAIMEKFTLEKLLSDQAIAELSNTNKTLKAELTQAWKEVDHWKNQAQMKGE